MITSTYTPAWPWRPGWCPSGAVLSLRRGVPGGPRTFITEGLADDEPVAVAEPEPKLTLLRTALGTAADNLTMTNMVDAGRKPGRIIAGVLRRFADAHPDRHVRIIGEPIWPGRTATEYPACVQHEALINPAFDGRNVTVVCPSDPIGPDDHILADAYATHPVAWEGDQRSHSDRYDPNGVITRYTTNNSTTHRTPRSR